MVSLNNLDKQLAALGADSSSESDSDSASSSGKVAPISHKKTSANPKNKGIQKPTSDDDSESESSSSSSTLVFSSDEEEFEARRVRKIQENRKRKLDEKDKELEKKKKRKTNSGSSTNVPDNNNTTSVDATTNSKETATKEKTEAEIEKEKVEKRKAKSLKKRFCFKFFTNQCDKSAETCLFSHVKLQDVDKCQLFDELKNARSFDENLAKKIALLNIPKCKDFSKTGTCKKLFDGKSKCKFWHIDGPMIAKWAGFPFFCIACTKPITSQDAFEEHNKSKKHLEKMNDVSCPVASTNSKGFSSGKKGFKGKKGDSSSKGKGKKGDFRGKGKDNSLSGTKGTKKGHSKSWGSSKNGKKGDGKGKKGGKDAVGDKTTRKDWNTW